MFKSNVTRIVRESDYSPAIALSEDNKALPRICKLVHFKINHFVWYSFVIEQKQSSDINQEP